MMKSKLLVVVAIALGFISCKTGLDIAAPQESYTPSVIAPVKSEFPLKVSLDVQKLENSINQKMNGLLFQGDKINNQDLSVKVWKAQPFQFTIKNNVIEYKVPLKLWTKFRWEVEKFGVKLGDDYEAEGSIVLNYKTSIQIDKNWKLVSTTTSNGYQWLQTPRLNVAGIQVPVTPVANFALNQGNKMISQQLDQTLAQMVDLKKYASMAWTEIQKPMQMSEENKLWVRVTPQEMSLSPFQTVGNNLNITMTLGGLVESFVGVQPPRLKAAALPALQQKSTPDKEFNLNLAADVTLDQITKLAKEQLLNKTFADGKKSITIKDLNLYGSNGKLMCMADVVGSIKGKIYFTGDLVFNNQNTSLEVQNPMFDLKTKNALLKSADWLLHGVILDKLKPYLTYNVADNLKQAKTQANTMLKNYQVYEGVNLQGQVNDIKVVDLQIVPGAVRVVAQARGNMMLKVAELKF